MYCLVFSVIFFIVGVIGVIPSFFAPLKIAEMKVCHPIPIIAKILQQLIPKLRGPLMDQQQISILRIWDYCMAIAWI